LVNLCFSYSSVAAGCVAIVVVDFTKTSLKQKFDSLANVLREVL
jgi:hypothetical protein